MSLWVKTEFYSIVFVGEPGPGKSTLKILLKTLWKMEDGVIFEIFELYVTFYPHYTLVNGKMTYKY